MADLRSAKIGSKLVPYPFKGLLGGGGPFDLVILWVDSAFTSKAYGLLNICTERLPAISVYLFPGLFGGVFVIRGLLPITTWVADNIITKLQSQLLEGQNPNLHRNVLGLVALQAIPKRLHWRRTPSDPKPLRVLKIEDTKTLNRARREDAALLYDPITAGQRVFMLLMRQAFPSADEGERAKVAETIVSGIEKCDSGQIGVRDLFLITHASSQHVVKGHGFLEIVDMGVDNLPEPFRQEITKLEIAAVVEIGGRTPRPFEILQEWGELLQRQLGLAIRILILPIEIATEGFDFSTVADEWRNYLISVQNISEEDLMPFGNFP